MSDGEFNFDELTQLGRIYSDRGSTNPVAILRASDLADDDRAFLTAFVKASPEESVTAWTKEAGPVEANPGMGTMSSEEYKNVAKRDFKAVDNMALLRFRMQNK